LLGDDPLSGKNYDHRKDWIEIELRRQAACFGIDLLAFALLSNHMHLVLRSRPDIVESWSDTEVARRWLMLCPVRKDSDLNAAEPTEPELNSIRNDSVRLTEIRSRLSDISWWMRLLNQRIAQRANLEDNSPGRFWESRFRGVRLLDEQSILACAVYVDLNLIRAEIAKTIELSDFTSAQRRMESLKAKASDSELEDPEQKSEAVPQIERDAFLAPVEIDELVSDQIGPQPSLAGHRASDKGFVSMPTAAYMELLDWTAREFVTGKRGVTAEDTPEVFKRLDIEPEVWFELIRNFGNLFSVVAGQPSEIDSARSHGGSARFRMKSRARELLSV
jgi:hypothetical protein